MGLKSMFSKNIECQDKIKGLIYLYPKRSVFVGKTIIVPNDCFAVFVFRDRVSDVLQAGKYTMNENALPKTFSMLHAGRFSRNNKYREAKKFKADIYFVSTKDQQFFSFQSDMPFVVKDKQFGKIRGFAFGSCTMKMFQPDLVMGELLDLYAYFKKGVFEKEVGYIIGNNINKYLEKSRIGFVEMLENNDMVSDYLNRELEFAFDNLGFRVTNIDIQALSLPDKIQLKVNEFLANKKKDNKAFDLNNLTSDKESLNYQQAGDSDIKGKEDIDLSMALNNTVRCSYCGTEVDAIFKTCPICGKNLKGE